jgi:hypothetical protein
MPRPRQPATDGVPVRVMRSARPAAETSRAAPAAGSAAPAEDGSRATPAAEASRAPAAADASPAAGSAVTGPRPARAGRTVGSPVVLVLLGAAAFLGALAFAQAGEREGAARSAHGPVALEPEPAAVPARTVRAGVPLPPLRGRSGTDAARHATGSSRSAPKGTSPVVSSPPASSPPPTAAPPAPAPTAPVTPPATAPAPPSPPEEGPTFYSEG